MHAGHSPGKATSPEATVATLEYMATFIVWTAAVLLLLYHLRRAHHPAPPGAGGQRVESGRGSSMVQHPPEV